MSKQESGIFVNIRFWTDFPKDDGSIGIISKQAWAAGSIYLRASKRHNIESDKPVLFNNLEEFIVKLDELLRKQGVTLVIQDDKGNHVPRLGKGYPKWTWTGTS